MLARLFVVLFVEFANQLFEDCAHAVIVETCMAQDFLLFVTIDGGGAEVDVGRDEFLDDGAEDIGFDHRLDLVAELELFEDFLHVRREAVEVRFKVRPQGLLLGAAREVAQQERGGVTERFARLMAEGVPLVDDGGIVEPLLQREHAFFRAFEHGVETAYDGHGQDDVAILAAHIDVAQAVVGDAPDEVDDLMVKNIVHGELPLPLPSPRKKRNGTANSCYTVQYSRNPPYREMAAALIVIFGADERVRTSMPCGTGS